MRNDIILVGDATTHRGVVITGSEIDTVNDRPIARKGDLVDCPIHGVNPIIEGSEGMVLNGRLVALEGHLTECGSELIASGNGSVS